MRALLGILVVAVASAVSVFAQPVADRQGVLIDKKPLKEFSTTAIRKINSGEVDPKAPFRVEFEAAVDQTGKYDASKSSFILAEGTAATAALVKDAITAVAESGYLAYVTGIEKPVDGKLLISASQSNGSFAVMIRSKVLSAERARVVVSSLRTLFAMGAMTAKEDEALILRYIRADDEGSNWVVTLSLPQTEVDKVFISRLKSDK